MKFNENIFYESHSNISDDPMKLVAFDNEESMIDNYLSPEVLIDKKYSKRLQEMLLQAVAEQFHNFEVELQSKSKKQMYSCKNSIFHNFQKHLITIIKKLVSVNERTFVEQKNGKLARSIWNAFLRSKSKSKKVFQVIFGASLQSHTSEDLQRLYDLFPWFKSVCANHSWEQVEWAQELIREEVCSQTQGLGRFQIISRCRVHKSEQFYQYFRSFILQLRSGQLGNRISKQQKQKLIVSLYSESKNV